MSLNDTNEVLVNSFKIDQVKAKDLNLDHIICHQYANGDVVIHNGNKGNTENDAVWIIGHDEIKQVANFLMECLPLAVWAYEE